MDEKLKEERVEAPKNVVEKANEPQNQSPVVVATKDGSFMKKVIPIIKSKAFLIGIGILIYTIIKIGGKACIPLIN